MLLQQRDFNEYLLINYEGCFLAVLICKFSYCFRAFANIFAMAWIDWDVCGLKDVGHKHIAVKFVVVFVEIHPYIIEVTA